VRLGKETSPEVHPDKQHLPTAREGDESDTGIELLRSMKTIESLKRLRTELEGHLADASPGLRRELIAGAIAEIDRQWRADAAAMLERMKRGSSFDSSIIRYAFGEVLKRLDEALTMQAQAKQSLDEAITPPLGTRSLGASPPEASPSRDPKVRPAQKQSPTSKPKT
jgi:hypothetical protein